MHDARNVHDACGLPCQNGPYRPGAKGVRRAVLHRSNGIEQQNTVMAGLSGKRRMQGAGNAAIDTHRGPSALRSF
ncbi:hypothetical protein A8D95_16370 [Burkholderia cenocepacia]|nr:hypothetical protein A8D61_18605 [Burkholderia cenocepacia]ONO20990.1 hypothetical protein A8D69_01390 [Burkholderia cenocepacia]ONO23982.1 hypothetical protein A8D71_35755 [Burkholderia cenocepacia]ONO31211.1 hypothetical protein A8D65_14765 [Burkholderia cenocepacia]ONO98045.1 hypothetical protein A8D79_10760 [Burkholderia cenocepacia]